MMTCKVVPPTYKLLYKPHEKQIYISNKNKCEIGVVGAKLASALGHDLVGIPNDSYEAPVFLAQTRSPPLPLHPQPHRPCQPNHG